MSLGSKWIGVLAMSAALGVASASSATVVSYLSNDGQVNAVLGPNPDGGAHQDLVLGGTETGSMYIWLRNDAKLQSLAYDITASTPGVIEFTGAQVFQYDLLVGGVTDIGDRWNLPTSNGTLSADRQGIINMSAVNVDKAGLDVATRSFDAGYEAGTNSALFGKIDFKAIGAGTTNIGVSVGSTLIVEDSVVPTMEFFGGSVGVTGGVVNLPPVVSDKAVEIFSTNLPTIVSETLDLADDDAVGGVWSLVTVGTPNSQPATVDPQTGLFSWMGNGTPEGVYDFDISFTDVGGLSDTGTLAVTWHIPEPSSIALLGLALVGFAGFRRK